MAQKYGFFNSVNNDRVYDASDVARFLSKFFTNGVFNNTLMVTANDNMTVSVSTGSANINGYGYENTESLTLDIDDADSELGRIDSVICRLDLTNRQITTQILQGEYASTPSQPSITRTGTVYDLRLANILVDAGVTRITTEDITDTRLGSECGNVTQAVLSLDTSDLFAQYQAWFEDWFADLQDELDDNQAGHLQNEIGTLTNLLTTEKGNLVGAINEIVGVIITKIYNILGLDVANWSSSNTYAKGDTVCYNNKIYYNLTGNNTSTNPASDTTNWEFEPIIKF